MPGSLEPPGPVGLRQRPSWTGPGQGGLPGPKRSAAQPVEAPLEEQTTGTV